MAKPPNFNLTVRAFTLTKTKTFIIIFTLHFMREVVRSTIETLRRLAGAAVTGCAWLEWGRGGGLAFSSAL